MTTGESVFEELGTETIVRTPHLTISVLEGSDAEREAWQQEVVDSGLYVVTPDGERDPITVMPYLLTFSPETRQDFSDRVNAVAKALAAASTYVASHLDYFRGAGIVPSPDDPTAHPNEAEAQDIMDSEVPGGVHPIALGRVDMFPVVQEDGSVSFRAIEANMRCVESVAYSSLLQQQTDAFGIPAHAMPPVPAEMVFDMARSAYDALPPERQTGGEEPGIAFLNWPNDPLKAAETPIIKRLIDERVEGANITVGRPDGLFAVEADNGRLDVYLAANDDEAPVKVDVIYRNIGPHDFTWEIDGQAVHASVLKDIIKNPDRYNCSAFPSTRQGFAGYKSMFAVINEPAYEASLLNANPELSPEELVLARETLGWSRMLSHLEADSPDYQMVAEFPDRFVVKHIAGAGGKDVVLGWSPDSINKGLRFFPDLAPYADELAGDPETAWKLVVSAAHRSGGYLVQEKIDFLKLPDGSVLDVNPYIIQGKYQGQVVSRIGKTQPINVKQGGGVMLTVLHGAS